MRIIERPKINRRRLDLEFPCNTEIPPAIPDGEYEVKFVGAEESHQWNSDKIFLWFEMLTPGEWEGKEFFMACNARKDGKWGSSHKYMHAWTLASGKRPPRRDRVSTKVFCDKVFKVRMRTVSKDANQRARTPAQQYSVVDQLLERVSGAADVSCKPLSAQEDYPPPVGIGAGASESTRESDSVSDGIGDEYERRCWREYEEECEEAYGNEYEEEEEEDE